MSAGQKADFPWSHRNKESTRFKNIVCILKQMKRSDDMLNDPKTTLLHLAARQKNYEITKYLIKSGANVNAQDRHGRTPLMSVFTSENPTESEEPALICLKYSIVTILVKSKANIYLHDNYGTSVWQMLSLKSTAIIQLFLNDLYEECSDSESIARRLVDVNCPLTIAVLTHDTDVVKFMLNSGIPIVNFKTKESALHLAICLLDVNIVELILKHGADACAKDASGRSPMSLFGLNYINNEKHLKILQLLLDHGAYKFSEGGEMSIKRILEKGNREAISMLFRYDLDCLEKDAEGRTVLHYLALNRNPSIVEEIRGKEFDYNHVDRSGLTALHLSIKNLSFLEYLLENGADVDSTGHGSSATTLFLVVQRLDWCSQSDSKKIEVLIKYGASPQVKHNGQTLFQMPPKNVTQQVVMQPIIARLVLLETLGTQVNKTISEQIQKDSRLQQTYNQFNKHIMCMKNYCVYKSVNLYMLLTASEKQIECYMRNRELAENVLRLKEQRVLFQIDTPLYDILGRRVTEAMESIKLKRKLGEIIFDITGFHYVTHHLIVDNIMSNFDIKDLRMFG